MYEVAIRILATQESYWASLTYTDPAGRDHQREVTGNRQASKQNNTLQALKECLERLKKDCKVKIYTDDEAIVSAITCDWMKIWENNGWKTAKGKPPRNVEQWQQVRELSRNHVLEGISTRGKK